MGDHAPRHRSYDGDVEPYDQLASHHPVAPYQPRPSVRNDKERSVPLFLSDHDGIPDPSEFTPSRSREHGTYYATRILAGALGGIIVATIAALVSSSESGREFMASAKASSVAVLSVASVVMPGSTSSHPLPAPTIAAPTPSTPTMSTPAISTPTPATVDTQASRAGSVVVAAATPTRDDIKTAYQGALQGGAPQTATAPVLAPATLQPDTLQAASPQEAVRHLDAGDIAALLKRAESLTASGDVAAARLVLRRAVEAGDGHAAMLLGRTYDPMVLEQQGVRGVVPDLAMARSFYEKAQQFGAPEATAQLERLARKQN